MDSRASANPLSGLRVIITRPSQQTEPLASMIRAFGGMALSEPLIEIRHVAIDPETENKLRRLEDYDGWIVTSANGVRALAEQCKALGIPMANLPQGYTLGKSTLLAAERVSLPITQLTGVRTSLDLGHKLVEMFRGGQRRILSIEGNRATTTARSILQNEGHQVDTCVLYETIPASPDSERWMEWIHGQAAVNTAILVYSPSAAAVLDAIVGHAICQPSRRCAIACIGPTTEAWCVSRGITVNIVPTESTDESLCQAVSAWWQHKAVQSTD